MRLYDITSDYRTLFDAFDDAENLSDEQVQAYFDTLKAIEGDFEIKAENIACFIKELNGEIETLSAEESALNARRKVKENLRTRLKTMLIDNMTAINKKKIDRPRAKLSLKQNPESVDIGEPYEKTFIAWAQSHNHDDLLSYKAPTIAKTAVKQAIKDGAELPPYVKIVRTTSVIIK